MYPNWSEKETWNICIRLLEKDIPFPNVAEELMNFQDDFHFVYEKIKEEHSHTKNKYYRTEDKKAIVNPLHLGHYARLMYYFSHRLFLKNVDKLILDQIFLSIKSRCSIDLFYELDIKEYFIPAHAFATILGRAEYNKYFIVSQCCTVGNNKGIYPSFGKGVVLRPGSMVLGNCKIGDNVQIAAGALVIDRNIPNNSIVFGRGHNIVIKENKYDNISERFD